MRRITIVALVAVLALVGAACGGDDDDTGSEDPEATDDGGSTDDDGGDGNALTDEDLGDFIDDDCEFLLSGAFMNPIGATASGTDADFEDTADQLDAIADAAPDEIKDAMKTLAEGYAEIAELFKDIDLSDPQSFQDPDTQEAIQELESIADDEYNAAAEEVSTWMGENCTGAASN